MAGDWIKWEKGLQFKPEVLRLSSELNMSVREVAACLMELWSWADGGTENGYVPGVTMLHVDRVLNVTGFANSLRNVGWLKADADGIVFPNFERHNGKSAKNRALTKIRMGKMRSKPLRSGYGDSVTKSSLEKRREEYRINTSNDVLTAGGSGEAEAGRSKSVTKAKADAKPEHGEFVAAWGKAWSGKYGKPYAVANHAKENTHVKQILDAVDRDPKEATLLAARYLADDDPFVADKCHPIALLVTRVNQYRGVKTHPAIFHPTEDDPIWDELARNLQNDNWVDPKTARERWTKANSSVSDQATMP